MGKELPKNWVECTLSEVFEIVTGNTPSKSFPEYYGGNIPWVKPGDINKSVEILHTDEYLSKLGFEKSRKIPKGSIMVTCIGNLGNIAITGTELATNQQINSIVIRHSLINKKYVYYYSNLLKPWLVENSTSTTIAMVNKSNFEKAPFIFPPLAEQNRIVEKLDRLFAQLEILKTSMAKVPLLLKDFRQQVLTQAVTGKLTEEWRKGKVLDIDYLNTVNKFHDSKIKPVKVRGQKGFEIKSFFDTPKTWNWIPVFKLVKDGGNSICAGPFGTIFKAKDFRNEGIPIIFLRHVKKEGFNQRKPLYMDKKVWTKFHQEYSVFGGELLVTKLGDPPGEATIFPNDFGVAMVTPDIMKADFNDDIFKTKFAMYFFNSSIAKDIIAEVSFGMTRLRIDLTMFKSMPIPVPTLKEQQEIVARVESLFAKADAIEQQYKSLKAKIDILPQSILHKAFKGELSEQLDTDGNAKELLKQIEELKSQTTKTKKK